MIFIVDLNHDLNQWFKSFDLNHNNPAKNVIRFYLMVSRICSHEYSNAPIPALPEMVL